MSKKGAKKEHAINLLEAKQVVSSLEKFLTFLFLYESPYMPTNHYKFQRIVNDSFQDKAGEIRKLVEKNEDPYPSIERLLKDLVCWDILYRRFRFGLTMDMFPTIRNKQDIFNILEIKEENNCFQRFRRKTTVVTDQSEKDAYTSAFKRKPYDKASQMFSFYSVKSIENTYFTNKKVRNT